MHKHKTTKTSNALPYFGPVSARRPNPAAHGGVRYVDRCACGASRETLTNAGYVEVGEWTAPESEGS